MSDPTGVRLADPDTAALQNLFFIALPRIARHARFYFRYLKREHDHDDAVAEAVALAWNWFIRLVQQGKTPGGVRVCDRSVRRSCRQRRPTVVRPGESKRRPFPTDSSSSRFPRQQVPGILHAHRQRARGGAARQRHHTRARSGQLPVGLPGVAGDPVVSGPRTDRRVDHRRAKPGYGSPIRDQLESHFATAFSVLGGLAGVLRRASLIRSQLNYAFPTRSILNHEGNAMTASTSVINGRPQRKLLSEELDRLDSIVDAIAEGLPAAVAAAAREGRPAFLVEAPSLFTLD